MSFTLGFAPEKFKLVVAAGSDFSAALTRKDGVDWPDGTELVLDFGDVVPSWSATILGATATWDEDEADVDALIAAKPKKVKLWYLDGPTRVLWAQGAVVSS